jgi:hypothetical protein
MKLVYWRAFQGEKARKRSPILDIWPQVKSSTTAAQAFLANNFTAAYCIEQPS